MKLCDIPQSGRSGSVVYCHRGQTQYVRRHVRPTDHKTAPQRRVRKNMGAVSKGWPRWLSELERRAWDAAAEKLQSRPRLGQSGPLTGEMLFSNLNCPRELIGREWLRLPSEPVVFGPSPVAELVLRRVQGHLRLELAVSGPLTEDIMVFATPPCRPTWRKCRKPRYLGLLPVPANGVSDLTALYVERFGDPEPGQRIFIRTVQQRDGWKSNPADTSNLVPAKVLPPQRRTSGSSFIIPVLTCRSSPCPWDVHAVRTVGARLVRAGSKPSPARARAREPTLAHLHSRLSRNDSVAIRMASREGRQGRYGNCVIAFRQQCTRW